MARRVHGLLGGSVSLEPSCESGSLERTCASSPTRQPPTLAREAAVVSRAKQPPILLLLLLLLLPYTLAHSLLRQLSLLRRMGELWTILPPRQDDFSITFLHELQLLRDRHSRLK